MGVVDAAGKPVTSTPTTAWRTVAMGDGSVVMLHQRALDGTISTKTGGYGNGPCKDSGIVSTAMTVFSGATSSTTSIGNGAIAMQTAMAVDVVPTPDGKQLTLIGAGSGNGMPPPVSLWLKSTFTAGDTCQFPSPVPLFTVTPGAQLTAGAYDLKGQLWIQSRSPAQLFGPAGAQIAFVGAEDRSDEGHRLFHTVTPGMIACASCHAEAGDDGHVWSFDTVGARRTQDLRGGILATAPFHWDGDMTDMTTLMNQVFSGRMAGGLLVPDQIHAVGAWVDGQPALPKGLPKDAGAVERGKTLFNDPVVACAKCHTGTHFTNNLNFAVGTGKDFQVPSLYGVASRAPFLHTGCAATLRDRFDPTCGGGDSHGKTSQLTSGQLDDLVAYLETL
jgi:mono/diheme cytochrome c family protein